MGVHLMKIVLNTAIMFLTYEVVNSWLVRFTVIEILITMFVPVTYLCLFSSLLQFMIELLGR